MMRIILLTIFLLHIDTSFSDTLKISERSDSYLNVTAMNFEKDSSRLAVLAGNKVSLYDVDAGKVNLNIIVSEKLSENIYEGRDILLENNNIYITSSRGKFIWARWNKINGSIEIKQVSNIMRDNNECVCTMLLSESKKYLFIINNNKLDVFKLEPEGLPSFLYSYSGPNSSGIVDMAFSKKDGRLLLLTHNNYLESKIVNESDGALYDISSERYEAKIMTISTDSHSGALYAITTEEVDPDTGHNAYIRTLSLDRERNQYVFGLKHSIKHHYKNRLVVNKGNIYIQDGSKLKHFHHDIAQGEIIATGSEFDFDVTLGDLSIVLADKTMLVSSGVIEGVHSFSIDNEGRFENKGIIQNEHTGMTPVFADTAITPDGTRLYTLTRNFYLQTYERDPNIGKIRLVHEANTSLAHNKKADGERLVLDGINNFLYLSSNDVIKVYSLDPENGFPTLKSSYDLQLPIYINSHDLYLSHHGERLYAVGSDVWKFKIDMKKGTLLGLEAREGFNNADQMVFANNDEFVYLMDRGDSFSNLIGGIFGYKQDLNSGSWEEVFALRNDFGNEAIELSSDEKYLLAETSEGIGIFSRDTSSGELTLTNTLTGYIDKSGVERIFYDIFRLKLLNNDSDLLVFSYNNILHFRKKEDWSSFEFVERLYLPTDVDESSSSGGSYLTVAPDQRFMNYSSVYPEASYILSFIDESESNLSVTHQPDLQYVNDAYYEKDIKMYVAGAGNYIFNVNNLPPGLNISDEGVISGHINRASLMGTKYDSIITVSDSVSSVEIELGFSIVLENTAPESESQNIKLESDEYVFIDIVMKDSDSDTVVLDITKNPTSGFITMVDNDKGKIRYQAMEDIIDMDEIEYTLSDYGLKSAPYKVTLNKNQSNIGPIANDDSATTEFETSITIDILQNDTDDNGQIMNNSVTIVKEAQNGVLKVMDSGEVKYTPAQRFSGNDSFQYNVKDDEGAVSNIATVDINVKVKTGEDDPSNPPSHDDGESNGGGGSAPGWLLFMLLLTFTARRYYK